ncbi:hypothetical protein FC83_GL002896 [Agrilactobacillus composti DSM 18527 = JCM 14202]|uniref:ABC transporter domain-containing protein n=1 Tax=Agrilactobacillus composti DSM 18527 = JCM 14202 TaxID=1423734 RepID=X0QPZ9_9LACO|nr:ABC transporter ATP-binding protein [Agrilactobacillus composti]KRM33328.1 hypothetical protein FC83_GL002896 [Agrilactobacillus composti DSM 18527 = JCM 14202]GAF40695.1 ABC transporter, ATP-binding protein [Agrilactobacillus composti DSM 18527 = JCM 14202]
MENLLEVRNLKKEFKNEQVLKNINLTIAPNDIVAFIGANGAGKSTTLKTILDITHKDGGMVAFFDDKDLPADVKLKEDVGVVFDACKLPGSLNINEVNLVLKQFFATWNEAQFFELIKEFSLETNKKLKTFSKGMLMKLSIIISLSHDAKLLILDEVTSGLDAYARQEILLKLRTYVAERNGGILLSSHIVADIEEIASRIVILKDGEIILNEAKDDLLANFVMVEVQQDQLDAIDQSQIIIKQRYGEMVKLLMPSKHELPASAQVTDLSLAELGIMVSREGAQ